LADIESLGDHWANVAAAVPATIVAYPLPCAACKDGCCLLAQALGNSAALHEHGGEVVGLHQASPSNSRCSRERRQQGGSCNPPGGGSGQCDGNSSWLLMITSTAMSPTSCQCCCRSSCQPVRQQALRGRHPRVWVGWQATPSQCGLWWCCCTRVQIVTCSSPQQASTEVSQLSLLPQLSHSSQLLHSSQLSLLSSSSRLLLLRPRYPLLPLMTLSEGQWITEAMHGSWQHLPKGGAVPRPCTTVCILLVSSHAP